MSSHFEECIYIPELAGPCSNLYMKLAVHSEINIANLPAIYFHQPQCKAFEEAFEDILRSVLKYGFDEFASQMEHGHQRIQKARVITNLGNMSMLNHN